MRDFRNYDIWKFAMSLAKEIYLLTNTYPDSERFGLCSRMRRSVVSIGSNIAEGCSRASEKDFSRF